MLDSLLYVSTSALVPSQQALELERIVQSSQGRNLEQDVTGALVFTERHFAQYLEGPEEGMEELMASIRRDWRHKDVQTVYREPISERRFPTWSMAYAGPSTFVAGHVRSLLDVCQGPAGRKAAERLIILMRQFVEAQLIEQRRNTGRS